MENLPEIGSILRDSHSRGNYIILGYDKYNVQVKWLLSEVQIREADLLSEFYKVAIEEDTFLGIATDLIKALF